MVSSIELDDYFSSTKLEEANNAIKQNSFDVFSNSEWIIDENDTKSKSGLTEINLKIIIRFN